MWEDPTNSERHHSLGMGYELCKSGGKIKLLLNEQASDHASFHFSLFSINLKVMFEIPALTSHRDRIVSLNKHFIPYFDQEMGKETRILWKHDESKKPAKICYMLS